MRVRLDVGKKLTRIGHITKGGETEPYSVKYEKLPTLYYECGLMGHWYEECGSGEHDASKFEWGRFILSSRNWLLLAAVIDQLELGGVNSMEMTLVMVGAEDAVRGETCLEEGDVLIKTTVRKMLKRATEGQEQTSSVMEVRLLNMIAPKVGTLMHNR